MSGALDLLLVFTREEVGDRGLAFAISNMIFDETELELTLSGFGAGCWSVLASHAQLSFRVKDRTHDFDVIRLPVCLPDKRAKTMWPALCAQEGGLWPSLSLVPARLRAILTTSDAAASNIKLLKHLQCVLDESTLLFPHLCLQHRTGNVIERMTKVLGVLTGCYAVAKTLASGSVQRRLVAAVREVFVDPACGLQVVEEVPLGSEEEWASGRVAAQQILGLVAADEEAQAGTCTRSSWTSLLGLGQDGPGS